MLKIWALEREDCSRSINQFINTLLSSVMKPVAITYSINRTWAHMQLLNLGCKGRDCKILGNEQGRYYVDSP